MDNKVYSIVLDIKDKRKRTDIEVVQFDNKTTEFNILLKDGLNDYNIGDGNVEVIFGKPDGNFIVVEKEIVNGSNINVVLTDQILARPGVVEVEVEISKEDAVLTSTKFEFSVRGSIKEQGIISTTEYKELEKIIQEAEKVVTEMTKAAEALDNVDELKLELADINEKIISAKEDIDKQIGVADTTVEELKSIITGAKKALNELEAKQVDIENLKGLLIKVDELSSALSNLDESIASAKAIKDELDTSISTATDKVTALSSDNETATSNITSLGEVNTTAKATEKSLKATNTKASGLDTELGKKIESGTVLSTELDGKITDGSGVRESLVASTAEANTSKTDLDASVETAKAINIELDMTNTTAVGTNTTLGTTLIDAKETESKLLEIIAQGDLAKYITDDKLRAELLNYVTETRLTTKLADYLKNIEAEKTYATKIELAAIDVSGQLLDYEKTVDVDKKINDINAAIGKKADSIYLDGELDKKSSIVYVDTALEKKASIDYVTTTLNTAIEELIDNSPDALNTLKELADALGNDANFANTIAIEIGTKVEKKAGYGLSKNDYTDTDKLKVANIPANPNYNDTVTKINGKTGEIGKEDIIKVIGNVGKESTIEDLDTSNAYDVIYSKASGLYRYMNGFFGTDLPDTIQTLDDLLNNGAAMTMASINENVMTSIVNSNVAMDRVLKITSAFNKILIGKLSGKMFNSEVAVDRIISNTTVFDQLINDVNMIGRFASSNAMVKKIIDNPEIAKKFETNANILKWYDANSIETPWVTGNASGDVLSTVTILSSLIVRVETKYNSASMNFYTNLKTSENGFYYPSANLDTITLNKGYNSNGFSLTGKSSSSFGVKVKYIELK